MNQMTRLQLVNKGKIMLKLILKHFLIPGFFGGIAGEIAGIILGQGPEHIIWWVLYLVLLLIMIPLIYKTQNLIK